MVFPKCIFLLCLFAFVACKNDSNTNIVSTKELAGSVSENSSNIVPLEMASSRASTCAITSTGIVCWGPTDAVNDVPQYLRSPRQISANADGTFCVLTDDGVRCWGVGPLEFLLNAFNNLGLVRNPIAKSELTHLLINDTEDGDGYLGMAKSFPNADGSGYVTYKRPRLFAWNEWYHSPTQIAVNDEDVVISNVYKQNDIFMVMIDKEVWAFSSRNTKPVKIPGLYNPSQVVASFGGVCGLMNGILKCSGGPSDGEAFVPYLLRNITGIRKIATTPNHEDCAITKDSLICWKGSDPLNASASYSLPAGTLKNPTDLSMSGNEICITDEEQIKCWGKDWEKNKLIEPPYYPLKKSAPKLITDNLKPNCESIDTTSALIGTSCATTRGFLFERMVHGWKDTAAEVIWSDEMTEESNANNFQTSEIKCLKKAQKLPSKIDFATAYRHGLLEVFPDMLNKYFWFSSQNVREGGVFYNGHFYIGTDEYMGEHFRCIQ